MSVRSRSSRFVLWMAMCALLLKAAVPLLASAAAGLQGKAVGEICNVYGVVLPGAADPHAGHQGHASHGHGHHPHDAAGHSGDHCALQGLAALALPDLAAALPPLVRHAFHARTAAGAPARAADDCALWVARQKQGPPLLA